MAIFGKKGKKTKKASAKKAAKEAKSRETQGKAGPVQAQVLPDIYTLFLGLSALFLITATLVLGLNYYWYQNWADPAVLPINTWAR